MAFAGSGRKLCPPDCAIAGRTADVLTVVSVIASPP
jgi:hypothetical protein